MSKNQKSILFNTSAGTDVQYVGGEIQIPGLDPIKQSNIVNFSQVNYRAEVSQVVTVGGTSYTPTASTRYIVTINDVRVRRQGLTGQPLIYSFTTPANVTAWLGGVAATQREAIHVALIADINAAGYNYVTAATLTGGAGFTITDDAGYFPVNSQTMTNRQGASTIKLMTDEGGLGFDITNIALTTAAVYASGVGATLAASAPVFDLVYTNLISGYIDGPKTIAGATAVSGQKYNMFSITYKKEVSVPTTSSYDCFQTETVQVWVDNGAGSSVANLAGYIALERQLHRGLFNQYSNDSSAQVDFLDNVILFQGPAGAVPATTGENKMVSDAKWVFNQIGTNATPVPTPSNDGLLLDMTETNAIGAEFTPSLLTLAPQEFIVGKTDISVFARIKATDYTDAAWQIGLHTKAAHSATFAYSNLASVGTLAGAGDTIVTNGILASAALVSTTALTPVDSTNYSVEVLVNKAGAVTCKVNDVVYPVYSVGTTPLVFVAGTVLVPFVRSVNISGGDPTLVLSEVLAVPSIWKY